MGDFNAHLAGNIEGMNAQGHLLHGVLERCGLNAVSLGSLASGPGYTYCSGSTRTTIDYILMDVSFKSMLQSCQTLQMDDLNTSDHLPIVASLQCPSPAVSAECRDGKQTID